MHKLTWVWVDSLRAMAQRNGLPLPATGPSLLKG